MLQAEIGNKDKTIFRNNIESKKYFECNSKNKRPTYTCKQFSS